MSRQRRGRRRTVWIVFGFVMALVVGVATWWWLSAMPQRYTGVSGGLSYEVVAAGSLHTVKPTPDESIPSEVGLKFRLDGQDVNGGIITIGTVAEELYTLTTAEVVKQAEEAYSQHAAEPGGTYRIRSGLVGRLPAIVIDYTESFQGFEGLNRIYIFDVKKRSPTMFIACSWNKTYTARIDELCDQVAASFTVNLSGVP